MVGRIGIISAISILVGLCTNLEAKELKIGYVSIAKVFDEYDKTKASDKTLEKKGQEKQLDREKYVSEIKKMKDELELLSDKARADKQRDIDSKVEALQRFDRETSEDLRRERDMMAREILKDIDAVIKELGKQEGYNIIFDDRVLLYTSEELDFTNKLMNILNTRYGKTKK